MITDTKIAAVKQGPENLSGSLVCGGRLGGVYDRLRLRAHGSRKVDIQTCIYKRDRCSTFDLLPYLSYGFSSLSMRACTSVLHHRRRHGADVEA